MSAEVLEHKLEAQNERNPEEAWNVRSVPKGLGKAGQVDRFFVASNGVWCGYFVLTSDVLWSPEDTRAPWTLLFDTKTWTPIEPVPVKRFRGIRHLNPGEIGLD
jgi:hypothetical protein